jgi:endonuclease/exonuclease/phosphatase family metal-dependent hydrolase
MNPLSEDDQPVSAYAFNTTQQDSADSIREQGIKYTADTDSMTSYVVNVSFETRRFDHLIASKNPNPSDCRYDPDVYECSDHAPILAEFDL